MTNKWSEPWLLYVKDEEVWIEPTDPNDPREPHPENAIDLNDLQILGRIISCVNACTGLSDPSSLQTNARLFMEAAYEALGHGEDEKKWPPGIHAAQALKTEIKRLKGVIEADTERLIKAAGRVEIPFMGCDTPEVLADTIIALWKELSANKAVLVALQRDNKDLKDKIHDYKVPLKNEEKAHERTRKELGRLREKLEELKTENNLLADKLQLDVAVGERLRDLVREIEELKKERSESSDFYMQRIRDLVKVLKWYQSKVWDFAEGRESFSDAAEQDLIQDKGNRAERTLKDKTMPSYKTIEDHKRVMEAVEKFCLKFEAQKESGAEDVNYEKEILAVVKAHREFRDNRGNNNDG
jgi:chromosome segregation ATPase